MEFFYLVWFGLVIWVGVAASNKGRSGIGWGLLAFLFSPLLIGIILACCKDLTVDQNLTKVNMEQQLLKDRVVQNERMTEYRLGRVENDVSKLENGGANGGKNIASAQIKMLAEGNKLCPACAELIKEAAIKCKHCGVMLEAFKTSECPFCSEAILSTDVTCKHCKSVLTTA